MHLNIMIKMITFIIDKQKKDKNLDSTKMIEMMHHHRFTIKIDDIPGETSRLNRWHENRFNMSEVISLFSIHLLSMFVLHRPVHSRRPVRVKCKAHRTHKTMNLKWFLEEKKNKDKKSSHEMNRMNRKLPAWFNRFDGCESARYLLSVSWNTRNKKRRCTSFHRLCEYVSHEITRVASCRQ